MSAIELKFKPSGDTLYFADREMRSGLYKILVPKGTHVWYVGLNTYLSDEPATGLAAMDAPPDAAVAQPCGEDTRRVLERLWAGETLSFYSPGGSGGLSISAPERSSSRFRADRDRWLYLQVSFPAGRARDFASQIVMHTTTQEPAEPMKIRALILGDSVAYGYLDSRPSKRLADHPQLVLNREQQLFDFCYNYAVPGASFTGLLSTSSVTRAANGLPNGCTLTQLLASTDAQAVLFNLGGNDSQNRAQLASNVKAAAQACQVAGKLFAFVGVIDINAMSAYNYAPAGTSLYNSGYIDVAADIAAAAEILRQTCRAEGYAYVDLRSGVSPEPWASITGDVIHPTQAYSTAIFTHVARSIAGVIPRQSRKVSISFG